MLPVSDLVLRLNAEVRTSDSEEKLLRPSDPAVLDLCSSPVDTAMLLSIFLSRKQDEYTKEQQVQQTNWTKRECTFHSSFLYIYNDFSFVLSCYDTKS